MLNTITNKLSAEGLKAKKRQTSIKWNVPIAVCLVCGCETSANISTCELCGGMLKEVENVK